LSLIRATGPRRSPVDRRAIFVAAAGLFLFLGVVSYFRSYATPDTGFLLDEAGRMLTGRPLYADLVDMNPPLTALLNVVVVVVARHLSLPEIVVFKVAFTSAVLGLLCLAAWLVRRLLPDEVATRRLVLILLAFAVFSLAGQDFGQREHLVLALILPYLLAAAIRVQGRLLSVGPAVLTGILAASAFAIKPHFVLLWPAVEIYVRLSKRVLRSKLLPETVAIGVVLALYTVGTLLWAPDYFRIIGLFAAPYSRFLYVPFWQLLFRGPGALLIVFSLLAFAALGRRARPPQPVRVFAVGALACLVAGAAQQKGFSYHFYPALALATVVLGLVSWNHAGATRHWVSSVYRITAVSLFTTVMIVVCVRDAVFAVQPIADPEQEQMERMLPLVRARAAGGPVYVMSYNISSAYPLLNYAGAHSASRFAQLWILASAYMDQLRGSRPLRYHTPGEMSPSERFLNRAVLEDLRDRRPRLLVVLKHARDLPVNGFRRLNYIAYFSRDPRIASELGRYQLVADLGEFEVFERIADGVARTARPPIVQPGTRDIVLTRPTLSSRAGLGDRGALLGLLAFVVIAIWASLAERGRVAMGGVAGSA
jgi:hypothetical protein